MDASRSVVSINDVILNRSCRDMGVGASYVRAAHHRWPNKPSISGIHTRKVKISQDGVKHDPYYSAAACLLMFSLHFHSRFASHLMEPGFDPLLHSTQIRLSNKSRGAKAARLPRGIRVWKFRVLTFVSCLAILVDKRGSKYLSRLDPYLSLPDSYEKGSFTVASLRALTFFLIEGSVRSKEFSIDKDISSDFFTRLWLPAQASKGDPLSFPAVSVIEVAFLSSSYQKRECPPSSDKEMLPPTIKGKARRGRKRLSEIEIGFLLNQKKRRRPRMA
uniref:Uncharacterized protein n=1 Tax=Cucumis melo TaxID=3656 RepID=A0A9I9EGZ4_CUCME